MASGDQPTPPIIDDPKEKTDQDGQETKKTAPKDEVEKKTPELLRRERASPKKEVEPAETTADQPFPEDFDKIKDYIDEKVTSQFSQFEDHYKRRKSRRDIIEKHYHFHGAVGSFVEESHGSVNATLTGGPGASVAATDDATSEEDWPWSAIESSARTSLEDLVYVLAVAALANAPALLIDKAAEDLLSRMIPVHLPDKDESAFGLATPRRKLLKRLRCEIEPQKPADNDNALAVDRIKFRVADGEHVVIKTAWNDLRLKRPWKETYLQWLRDLGKDRELSLRFAAGHACGVLATCDITVIEHDVIRAWLESDTPDALDAIDAALTSLSVSVIHRPAVKDLLKRWTNGDCGEVGIVAAGLLASGASTFGPYHPDIAFDVLSRLAKSKKELEYGLAVSAFELWMPIVRDRPGVAVQLFTTVENLARQMSKKRFDRWLSGTIFLVLINSRESFSDEEKETSSEDLDEIDQNKADDEEKAKSRAYQLFLRALSVPDAIEPCGRLFNLVLSDHPLSKQMVIAFEDLVVYASNGTPQQIEALVNLCHAMHTSGDEDAKETLAYLLDDLSHSNPGIKRLVHNFYAAAT